MTTFFMYQFCNVTNHLLNEMFDTQPCDSAYGKYCKVNDQHYPGLGWNTKVASGKHQTPPRCLFSWSEPAKGDGKVDHSPRSQLLLQFHACSPWSEHCGWEGWTHSGREECLTSRKEWAEPTEHLKPLHLGQRQHPPWVLHSLQRNKWGTGQEQWSSPKTSTAQLLNSYHSALEQNWQWQDIKGPNHQENLTIPAPRWFPVCLGGMSRAGTMLGTVAGWISSALAHHQGKESHCEHGVRNCKRKEENQYLQTHREIFHEDLLHFYSKPAAQCNGLSCFLFFSFINSDVDHYHSLLSVVITADKRDEPETCNGCKKHLTLQCSKSILCSVGLSWAKQKKSVRN